MGTKCQFFNFPVCKIYLGTWARRARRARGHVGHVEHVEHVGMQGTWARWASHLADSVIMAANIALIYHNGFIFSKRGIFYVLTAF